MRERLKSVLKKYLIVLAVGVLYLIFTLTTKIAIPCPIKLITKLDCPSCGITRMFQSIARLDFKSAYGYNQFLFITTPLILFCLILADFNYIKSGKPTLNKFNFLPYALIFCSIAFAIVRNLV